jgi:hypothetical protein
VARQVLALVLALDPLKHPPPPTPPRHAQGRVEGGEITTHDFTFSRRDPARGLPKNFRALEIRGRGECRMRAAPAVSCAKSRRRTHTSIQVQRRHSDIPAQWLYGLLRALPGDQDLFVTVAPWMMAGPTPGWAGFASAGLDANLEASGPHDFAVRGQHRSSARRPIAHGSQNPPCHHMSRLMLPRPPHPAPRL